MHTSNIAKMDIYYLRFQKWPLVQLLPYQTEGSPSNYVTVQRHRMLMRQSTLTEIERLQERW